MAADVTARKTAETATVRKQVVRIGELTPEGFEVLDGLEAGQKIATAGLQTLLDGQRVRRFCLRTRFVDLPE